MTKLSRIVVFLFFVVMLLLPTSVGAQGTPAEPELKHHVYIPAVSMATHIKNEKLQLSSCNGSIAIEDVNYEYPLLTSEGILSLYALRLPGGINVVIHIQNDGSGNNFFSTSFGVGNDYLYSIPGKSYRVINGTANPVDPQGTLHGWDWIATPTGGLVLMKNGSEIDIYSHEGQMCTNVRISSNEITGLWVDIDRLEYFPTGDALEKHVNNRTP